MPPPVSRVHACFNGDIRKLDVLDVSPVPAKDAQPTVGSINHQVLKQAIANAVVAIPHTDTAGAALDRAVADRDVFGHPLFGPKACHANAVVTGADVAV